MTNMTWLQKPGFGMPACGHAFAPAFANGAAHDGVTRVPSMGQVSLLEGTKGRTQGIATGAEVTGTSAWRPPTG